MIKTLAGATLVVALAFGSAQAVSFNGITEGNRDRVDGTTARSDVPSSGPGSPTGTLGTGDFYIFGRIVGAIDTYSLTFSATNAFTIDFHFGGYTTVENNGPDGIALGDIATSGLVGVPGGTAKPVTFGLTGETNLMFTSDVTSGPSNLFSGGPGTYTLTIDGTSDGQIAYYDLKINVVPLPAGILLLLSGLGGLGFLGWRRRRAMMTPA